MRKPSMMESLGVTAVNMATSFTRPIGRDSEREYRSQLCHFIDHRRGGPPSQFG